MGGSEAAKPPTAGQPISALGPTLDAANTPADEAAELVEVRQRLGRFVVLNKLGSGGMGAVYATYDEQLDRKVALKLLHRPPHLTAAEQESMRQRVLREAQALARVAHPNIVHVYDVGEVQGQIFIAMEYIAGMSLAAWQKGQRPWQEVLRVYRQAGAGLLAAHQAGLVHRDFKPDNVLVDKEERAHVADFGLARLTDGASDAAESGPPRVSASDSALRTPLTVEGAIAGTPGYMAPEQYWGLAVDSRSDQFSFCVALYQALYRRLPFAGDTVEELVANVIAGRVLPTPADSPIPIEIESALLRGLAVDRQARFPSMAELLTALDVDEERDPGGARSARRMLSFIWVLIVSIVAFPTFVLVGPTRGTARDMVIIGTAVFAAMHAGSFFLRKRILANAFHRGLARLLQIAMGTLLGVRCLGMLLHLDVATVVPFDLMTMAGGMAAVAYQYLPGVWWLVAELVAASVWSALWSRHALQIGNAAYLAISIGMAYFWSRAAGSRSSR